MSNSKTKKIDFDPYKLLQLEHGCEPGQIDKAYKKMALKWHPDKNPEQKEKAKEMFLKIYQAFEFLKDKVARTDYDEQVAAKKRRAEFDEVRQATSSAKRKEHLAKLHEAEKKAEKVGQKRKSEKKVKDQLIEELRREGAEMMERLRAEQEENQRRERTAAEEREESERPTD